MYLSVLLIVHKFLFLELFAVAGLNNPTAGTGFKEQRIYLEAERNILSIASAGTGLP